MAKADTASHKKQRKRNRVPISCTICRRRKVKCDKKKPQCTNCIKNGVQHLCRYLEPSWAKPLDEEELKFPGATVVARPSASSEQPTDGSHEVTRLKQRIRELEHENSDLKKGRGHQSRAFLRSGDNSDLVDCICNSNILFTAKKGPTYNFPIIYQISILSWMFIVRNDSYLNNLWLKILKLRKHYEYYYSSKNAMVAASKTLENESANYDSKMSKIKEQEGPLSVPDDKINEHTSKLKKFLEGTMSLGDKNKQQLHERGNGDMQDEVCPVTNQRGRCPVQHAGPDSGSTHSTAHGRSSDKHLLITKCPVLHPGESTVTYVSNDTSPSKKNGTKLTEDGDIYVEEEEDEIEDPKVCPLMIGDARALFKEKLARMTVSAVRDSPKVASPRVTSISADVIDHNGPSSLVTPETKPDLTTTGIATAKTSTSTTIAPLSTTSHQFHKREQANANTSNPLTPISTVGGDDSSSSVRPCFKRSSTCPVTGISASDNKPTPKKPRRNAKRLKTISPSAIKNLNYNNTKQVISVIEKHLPNRKIVWLLIDRFFDKVYLHLPYIDEESFRVKIASIIDSADSSSQKIKLVSIGSQYCEEFLSICLLLIIIRLSWLTLPSKITSDLTDNELLLMKPENLVTLVLVDMVKEIFSSAKILGKPSLIIFQVALYLKFYNNLSPEDGFDLDDSFTNTNTSLLNSNDLSGDLTNENPNMNSPNFMSMLVELARTIGLNRDPLNYKNFYSATDDPIANARLFRKRHLWRKLWYGLLSLSVESNLSLGDYKKGLPIEIDLDPTLGSINKTWDCRLPGGVEQGVLEKSFHGALLSKEQVVVNNFRNSIVVHHLLYRAMNALYSVDDPPTSKDMDSIMNKLLDLISDRSRIGLNTSFFLDSATTTTTTTTSTSGTNSSKMYKGDPKFEKLLKIYKFRLYLIVKSMLFSLNYLLFLNHEQKFNRLIAEKTSTLAKIDRQKEYINNYFEGSLLLAIDNYNVFVQVFGSADKLYPNCGAELILYPYLMILNHRSHEFLISLILRLQQNSPIVMEILNKNNIDKDELLKRLFHYLNTFQEKLEDLTKHYYYAWRLKKLVKFFYNILTNSSKLFSLNFKAMSIGIKENQNEGILENTPPTSNHTIPKEDYELLQSRGGVNGMMDSLNSLPQQQQQQQQQHSQSQSQYQQTQLASGPGSVPLAVQQQHQQQQVHIKKEPLNAFEIAFGTSKLPPVTDFANNNDMLNSQLQQEHHIDMNLYNELSRPTTANNLNDIFDEHFFNDLTDLNMGAAPNDTLTGLPYGNNSNGINHNNEGYEALQVQGASGLQFENGSNNNDGFGGFNGGVFNSLNEIDFTNVDLGVHLDNTPPEGSESQQQQQQQHGLGGLNFQFLN